MPTVSISERQAGSEGGSNAVFTVTVTGPGFNPISVNYAVAGVTATAGSDFVAPSGNLTIGPFVGSGDITIPIINDPDSEGPETFRITITGATAAGGVIVSPNNSVLSTITDNDLPRPTISIGSVSRSEALGPFVFDVTLSAASAQTVTVNYATADGTATAGVDYTAAQGTVTFTPGQTTQTVSVAVANDAVHETNETFTVGLDVATNATLENATGFATIVNDDAAPVVSIGNASVTEGDSGTATLTFLVTRTGATALASTVPYSTANGTATTGDADYVATGGALVFSAAAVSETQEVSVTVRGDARYELDETVLLNLASASNSTLGTAQGIGTIANDDALPVFSISAISEDEGSTGGTTAFTFTITRTGASAVASSLSYFTLDGSATFKGDFIEKNGTLTFAASDAATATQTVTVLVEADSLREGDETFSLRLFNANNATFAGGGTSLNGLATIRNDDATLTIAGVTQAEGSGGNDTFDFVVTRSGYTGIDSSATYTISNGGSTAAATTADDFAGNALPSGTVRFSAGETSQTISIPVNRDTAVEDDESFTVTLSAPSAGTRLTNNSANGTITNDDAAVVVVPDPPAPGPAGGGGGASTGNTVFVTSSYAQPEGSGASQIAVQDSAGTTPIDITGNAASQTIQGNDGANIINGLGGADTMIGLGGNDTYLVRGSGDQVIEANRGGDDTIFTTVSYSLGVNEVERLSTVTHTDTNPIDLTGNFATQVIIGNFGVNVLNGGSGGIDTLIGLSGNDIYAVGDSRTIVFENAGEGSDTVVTGVDYSLAVGASVEVLAAQNRAGTTALTLRGNEVAQTVVGNDGANTLDGGLGNDVLIGGGGADVFRFATALGVENVDSITDFETGFDRIALAQSIFGITAVTAANFTTGAATTADQRIVYAPATGQLFYDADGNGAGAGVMFAMIAPGTMLAPISFEVI